MRIGNLGKAIRRRVEMIVGVKLVNLWVELI
jgi:hypothetical protein